MKSNKNKINDYTGLIELPKLKNTGASKKITYQMKTSKKVALFIIVASFIGLLFSFIGMTLWSEDTTNIEKQLESINESVLVIESEDEKNVEIITQVTKPKKSDPYHEYIKMKLIDVELDKLIKKNKDIRGWIKVNGTNINYPFVQGKDNEYYLKHSFDKKYNDGGWVFLDYRNNIKNLDKNTIIYAHSRKNKTMFGTLENVLSSSWLKNDTNYVIKLSTEYENTLWQVFSVYYIPTTSDYLKTKFESDEEYQEFLDMISNRSKHDFKTSVNVNDLILTLSTCHGNTEKTVLHAKLIKRETRE